MDYFTRIEEGQAIIHAGGVYYQVPAYERGGKVYAKRGGGFVRLMAGGGTSCTNVRWSGLDTPHGTWREDAQYVLYKPAPVAAKLEAAE